MRERGHNWALAYAGALLVMTISVTAPAQEEESTVTNDIAFAATCDGTEQRYVQVLPAAFQPDEPYDVLIALHGHGSDRWQYVKDPRDECRAARDVATEHGMVFVSPDYRATTSWMGPKAEADLVDIITEFRKRERVRRVFLSGASMGGAACLTFAALHPELLDGVASMNGVANFMEYENFQDAIRASFGGSKEGVPDEYRKRSAEFHARSLAMPVGITTGGQDTSTPPASVLRLVDELTSINPNVLLIHREDEGHRTCYADAKAIVEFVIERAVPQPEP